MGPLTFRVPVLEHTMLFYSVTPRRDHTPKEQKARLAQFFLVVHPD